MGCTWVLPARERRTGWQNKHSGMGPTTGVKKNECNATIHKRGKKGKGGPFLMALAFFEFSSYIMVVPS
jgi:hypothetical protein